MEEEYSIYLDDYEVDNFTGTESIAKIKLQQLYEDFADEKVFDSIKLVKQVTVEEMFFPEQDVGEISNE